MVREPATLESARRLSPRDRVWAAIRKLGEFEMADLWREARVYEGTTRGYLRCLLQAEPPFIEVTRAATHSQGRRFRRVRDVGAHAPRLREDGRAITHGAAAENIWRSIRALREFSVGEIVAASVTDEVSIGALYARTFLNNLVLRGCLVRTPRMAGFAVRYRMIPARCHAQRPPATDPRKGAAR